MNKITRQSGLIWFTITALICLLAMNSAMAQSEVSRLISMPETVITVQIPDRSHFFENRMNALNTRRFSCTLHDLPSLQYEVAYSSGQNVSELSRMHAPSVFSTGKYLFATDAYSLYQFDYSNRDRQAVKSPSYTSNNIIVGVTEQSIIQKHRIDKQSCVTTARLSTPASESTVFCSNTYFKATYFDGSVFILSDIPCKPISPRKSCTEKSVSLERYNLDGNKSWSITLEKMPSASIVGAWNNTVLLLNSKGALTALNAETGSLIYTKDYASELNLEQHYHQFNHFYVDKETGLFIVTSRFHSRITVIDIETGSIIKTHDFGKAYAYNKFLEEDYHYIELGDYSFPLNTIMGMDNGVMYLRKEKNALAAVELKTGKQLWKYDIYNSPFNTDPQQNSIDIAYHVGDILITDDLVIIGYNKFATALNKTTGDVIWNYNFFPFYGHFGYQMWLSCVANHLLIQSDNIYLYSGAKTGK